MGKLVTGNMPASDLTELNRTLRQIKIARQTKSKAIHLEVSDEIYLKLKIHLANTGMSMKYYVNQLQFQT